MIKRCGWCLEIVIEEAKTFFHQSHDLAKRNTFERDGTYISTQLIRGVDCPMVGLPVTRKIYKAKE